MPAFIWTSNSVRRAILYLICSSGVGASAVDELPDITGATIFPGQTGTAEWLVSQPVGTKLTKISTSCGCSWANPLGGDAVITAKGVPIQIQYTSQSPGDHTAYLYAFDDVKGKDPVTFSKLRFHVYEIVRSPTPSDLEPSIWSKLELTQSGSNAWIGSRVFKSSEDGPAWKTMRVARVSRNDGTDEFWKFDVREQSPGEWLFSAVLSPRALMGRWSTKAKFDFIDDHGDVLPYSPTLSVATTIYGPVSALPETLLVGAMSPGEERKVGFSLQRVGAWDSKLINMVVDSGALLDGEVRLLTDPENRKFEVTIRAKANAKPGSSNGGVILSWQDGSRLRIPYLASVLGR